ncbi:MAG: SUMF1/EgtB/PvdO family nonheme iron enzyme, partial [Myxococcota bacterium]|nr:SUMF1/EgtB/PvdO family nonheme iron enzyme [Myxococcota bacterium]
DILETDADEPTEEASQKRKLSPETAAAPDENSEDAADAVAAPSADAVAAPSADAVAAPSADAGAAPSADAGVVPSADAGAVLAADTAVPVVEAVAGVVENTPSTATNSEDIDTAAAKKEGSTVAAADVAVPKQTGPIETTIPPAKWDCPAGMTEVFRKVKLEREGKKVPGFEIHCMDRREAGGPTRGISLYGAKAACERRGARLCSGKEWRRGCGGRYPYGNSFREDKCNTLSLDGYPRPVRPSGSFKKCRSMWGAYDMVGNVSEWTSDGYVRGGSNNNMDEARCNYAKRRAPGSSSSRVGYRCCADAFLKSDSKKNVE